MGRGIERIEENLEGDRKEKLPERNIDIYLHSRRKRFKRRERNTEKERKSGSSINLY